MELAQEAFDHCIMIVVGELMFGGYEGKTYNKDEIDTEWTCFDHDFNMVSSCWYGDEGCDPTCPPDGKDINGHSCQP